MCSSFTPEGGYDNSTDNLFGDVCLPITKCWGKLCLHKKTFQSLGRSNYQSPQCVSVCQVRTILFGDQTISLVMTFGQGLYNFEKSLKPIQDSIGDVYCPGRHCVNRRKSKSLDSYVTTPRSNYGFRICGAWLFVHKVLVTWEEPAKETRTD